MVNKSVCFSVLVFHLFRAKRLCDTQLISDIITTQDLASALNRHHPVDMAILDYSKAFDKVNRSTSPAYVEISVTDSVERPSCLVFIKINITQDFFSKNY